MIRIIAFILFSFTTTVLGQGAHYTYPFNIECPQNRVIAGEQVTITARFENGHTGDKYLPGYSWSVSMGSIVSGQGTSSITIVAGKDESGSLNVFLHRTFKEAHYPGVQSEATCTVDVAASPTPRMIDEFRTGGTNCEEGFARLDSFFAELSNNPGDQGLIVIYGDEGSSVAAKSRERQLRNHFKWRKFPIDRVTILRGVATPQGTTQFWMVPPGAEIPDIEVSAEAVDKPPTGPYLYAENQLDGIPGCSGNLYDYEEYAKVLHADPASSARIIIRESSRAKYQREVREILRELAAFGIARRRITAVYKYVRPNLMLEINELWILPGKKVLR
jgi:hypothetical protein